MNRRHLFALLWLGVIFILGAYSAKKLTEEGSIQTDLLALLPQGKTENMRLSQEFMKDGNVSGRIVIAFGHHDSESSKEALQQFRQKLYDSSFPITEQDIKKFEGAYKTLFTELYPHRAGLISKQDRRDLLAGNLEALVARSVANIISPFGSFDAGQMEKDPFGFYPRFVTSFGLDLTAGTDSDGNIVVNADGKTWHIFQGEVNEKIFSLTLQEQISNALLPILSEIETETGVEALRTGAVFYSTTGAQQARSEISQIGTFSTLGITLILFLVFCSFRPIFFALAVVTSGLIGGLAISLYFFGSVHILALVFGSSLVGVAVDYALHFYCSSFARVDRFKIFSLLMPAMPLGVLTSSLGYGALILAPFPGIQQMAVLACFGLLCTFVSVCAWGPYFLSKVENRKTPWFAVKIQNLLKHMADLGSVKYLRLTLVVILISISALGISRIHFDDSVRSFQAMDAQLKAEEEKIRSIMNFDQARRFVAVISYNVESILQTSEAIADELDKSGVSYRAITDLIPSQQRQVNNAQMKLEFCHDNFPEIAKVLGIEESSFDQVKGGFEDSNFVADADFLKKLPPGWKELVHVAPDGLVTNRIMVKNEIALNNFLDSIYIDPVHEYSLLFSSYRKVMMLLVAGLLLVFALMIAFFQGIRASISITTPILLSILTTFGIIGMLGTGFSMFHAMGLILVLCIGIDYALFLYCRSPGKTDLLLLGNTLAAITTILSFGLLTLSTTAAVYSFGASVFIGISLNFFITTLFLGHDSLKFKPQRTQRKEKQDEQDRQDKKNNFGSAKTCLRFHTARLVAHMKMCDKSHNLKAKTSLRTPKAKTSLRIPKIILIISILTLAFAGCGGTRFSQKPPSQISVTRTVKLNTASIWPLQTKGTFLQKITASVKGRQQTFTVHLTLEDRMLEAIAFNDVAGRLYKLNWTPGNVLWEGSAYVPSMIKPENILIDFLLAHLTAQQLHYVLKGAYVYEQNTPNGKVRIVKDRQILRKITFNNPIGNMWRNVVIENPAYGYKLEIQTVAQ